MNKDYRNKPDGDDQIAAFAGIDSLGGGTGADTLHGDNTGQPAPGSVGSVGTADSCTPGGEIGDTADDDCETIVG